MKTRTVLAGIASLSLLVAPISFAQQEVTEPQQETMEKERLPTTNDPTLAEPTQPAEMESTAQPAEQELDNERMERTVQPADQELDNERTVQPVEEDQEEMEASTQQTIPLAASKPAQQDTLVSSNTIVGATVTNAQGEELGEIDELMIDPQTGTVKHAVLALSGGWLTTAKRIALPWETLKIGLGKEKLVVEMDKNQLQNAPDVPTMQK